MTIFYVIGLVLFAATISLVIYFRYRVSANIATDSNSPSLLQAPFMGSNAEKARIAWADHLGLDATLTDCLGIHLTLIPPGRFEMGSTRQECELAVMQWPKIEPEWVFREQPKHSVVISCPFYLGTYPVTVGQFRQFASEARISTRDWLDPGFSQTDEHPVVNVGWRAARVFVRWLSRIEGVKYRLPTEAEWEYACRAGTTTRFYHGDDAEGLAAIGNVADAALHAVDPDPDRERINANDGYAFTSPVGQFHANQFGLYDMHGNVHEWCQDWHGPTYYSRCPETNPQGPLFGTVRVCRGGGWFDGPRDCRSANRGWLPPSDTFFNLGFRVVRDAAPQTGRPTSRRKAK